jgi:hypothetical protein
MQLLPLEQTQRFLTLETCIPLPMMSAMHLL